VETQRSFPHYNVIKHDENHYQVELALAGYGPENVEITYVPGKVSINSVDKPAETDTKHVYRGIAKRSFKMSLPLAQYVEVTDAEFDNGLLRISLERKLPDIAGSRRIKIGQAGKQSLTDQSQTGEVKQLKTA
jgi:molecular chaperone IbpA